MKRADIKQATTNWGSYVALHPELARFFGSINAALLWQQVVFWSEDAKSDLGVYKTVEDITRFTGMSYREQHTARKILEERGYLIVTNVRSQHRMYFRINWPAFNREHKAWQEEADGNHIPTKKERAQMDSACGDESANDNSETLKSSDETAIGCDETATGSDETAFRLLDNQNLSRTYPDSYPKSDSETQKKGRPVKQSDNEAFNSFWAVYPRKDAKTQARTAFEKKIKTPEMAEQVIEAVKQRRGIWSTDLKFIPLASTWLNNERWNEDAKTPSPTGAAPLRSSRAPMSSADAQRMIDTGDLNGFELA